MRYSLFSRFQAGLWGAVIGDTFSQGGGTIKQEEICLSVWSQTAIYGVQSLGQMGQLDLEDWQQQSQRQDLQQTASSGETAIATFAIALYYHDSLSFLRDKLSQAAPLWLHPHAQMTDVLVWGEAIALALTEKLNPAQFIPAILTQPEIALTPLGEQLKLIQHSLLAGTPLQSVVSSLTRFPQDSCTPIALALYCFLSTPEDFSLCVSRAVQTDYQTVVTATLAGMLSGVYNSSFALPIPWRLAVSRPPLGSEIEQLAWRLFQVWSGVYFPLELDEKLRKSAIAAPRVIQPRSTLSVISQRE